MCRFFAVVAALSLLALPCAGAAGQARARQEQIATPQKTVSAKVSPDGSVSVGGAASLAGVSEEVDDGLAYVTRSWVPPKRHPEAPKPHIFKAEPKPKRIDGRTARELKYVELVRSTDLFINVTFLLSCLVGLFGYWLNFTSKHKDYASKAQADLTPEQRKMYAPVAPDNVAGYSRWATSTKPEEPAAPAPRTFRLS
eukprot:gnl/TRDRNA2_/TRDRNA2_178716_c0_seq1.p1 gnl/TRDRNA2_/TRDRNA2_178716_c0~~gnl/TRDRNA2_/TRDRNA2_178716_c0_seq1.p1  ORF type:complete len:197 (+),score=30.69 gnl/TRDRNA2_/TRDRNA2_178716_c0_seq1:135-725(+)